MQLPPKIIRSCTYTSHVKNINITIFMMFPLLCFMVTTSSWLNQCQFWQIYYICAFFQYRKHRVLCAFHSSLAHYFKHNHKCINRHYSWQLKIDDDFGGIYAHEERRIISVRMSASCSRYQHLAARLAVHYKWEQRIWFHYGGV